MEGYMYSVSRICSGICQEVYKEAANYVKPLIWNSKGVGPEHRVYTDVYLCVLCAATATSAVSLV